MWDLQNTLIVYCRVETQTTMLFGVAKALWRHMTNDWNHSHGPQRPKTIIKRFLSEKCQQTKQQLVACSTVTYYFEARLPKQLELQQNRLLWTSGRRRFDTSNSAFDLDWLSDLRFVTVCGASFSAARRAPKKITFHPPWPFRACHSSARQSKTLSDLKAQKPLNLPAIVQCVARIRFFGTKNVDHA